MATISSLSSSSPPPPLLSSQSPSLLTYRTSRCSKPHCTPGTPAVERPMAEHGSFFTDISEHADGERRGACADAGKVTETTNPHRRTFQRPAARVPPFALGMLRHGGGSVLRWQHDVAAVMSPRCAARQPDWRVEPHRAADSRLPIRPERSKQSRRMGPDRRWCRKSFSNGYGVESRLRTNMVSKAV